MIVQFCKYALKKTPLNCTHFSFATPRGSWDPSSPTRDLNPRPQQLKCRIPTTGQTGNSFYTFFFFFFFFCSTRSLLQCVGFVPWPGIEPASFASEGRFLATLGNPTLSTLNEWIVWYVNCISIFYFLIASLFEIKYDLNKLRARSFSWTRSLNIINISILLKLIARFNTIPIQKSQSSSPEITKLILKCIWRCKGKAIDIEKIN